MRGDVELTYVDRDLAVGTFGPVLITYVRSTIDLPYLEAAHRTGRALAERHPRGIASLTLVPATSQIPHGPVRERARRDTRESDAWVAAGATVIAGDGFAASAQRSVLTALTMFTGGPPRKVFADPATATHWLAHELGLSRHALDAVVVWSIRSMTDAYRDVLQIAS